MPGTPATATAAAIPAGAAAIPAGTGAAAATAALAVAAAAVAVAVQSSPTRSQPLPQVPSRHALPYTPTHATPATL